MDGVVFAIDGKKRDAVARDGGHDHFPGGDEDFLVGEGDILAVLDGFVSGGQSDDADRGGNDRLRVRMSGDSSRCLRDRKRFRLVRRAAGVNGGAEFPSGVFGADGNNLGMMPAKSVRRRARRWSRQTRATTSNRPGSESTTLRHWRPIEPVEPRIEIRFMRGIIL